MYQMGPCKSINLKGKVCSRYVITQWVVSRRKTWRERKKKSQPAKQMSSIIIEIDVHDLTLTSPETSLSSSYCIAHDGLNVTGYQALFCPWNKPSWIRWLGRVQLVKAGDRGAFVVKSGHFYRKNWGDFEYLVTVFKVIVRGWRVEL